MQLCVHVCVCVCACVLCMGYGVCVMHCVRNCVQLCVCVCVCVCVQVHVHVLINSCLHLLSLQNGLTALEVARASTDKVWDEEEKYWDEEYSEVRRRRAVTVVSDYDGVVDLLSGYTAEPAVLPSHPVSGTIISLPLVTSDAVFCFNCTGTGQHSRPTGHRH